MIYKVVSAANFVQTAVSLYERHYASLRGNTAENTTKPLSLSDSNAAGKECSNLIVLLSELYNFQVVSSILVYDIIRGLLAEDLTEHAVELLLKIVRSACSIFSSPVILNDCLNQDSGQQLRHDDPSALKDIIQIVQNKVAGKDELLR